MKKLVLLALPVLFATLSAQATITRGCSYSYTGSLVTYKVVKDHGQSWHFEYDKNEVSGSGTVSARAHTPNGARKEARDNLLGTFSRTAKAMALAQLAKAPRSTASVQYNLGYDVVLEVTGDTGCRGTKTYAGNLYP